jgi:hypothetical protein
VLIALTRLARFILFAFVVLRSCGLLPRIAVAVAVAGGVARGQMCSRHLANPEDEVALVRRRTTAELKPSSIDAIPRLYGDTPVRMRCHADGTSGPEGHLEKHVL